MLQKVLLVLLFPVQYKIGHNHKHDFLLSTRSVGLKNKMFEWFDLTYNYGITKEWYSLWPEKKQNQRDQVGVWLLSESCEPFLKQAGQQLRLIRAFFAVSSTDAPFPPLHSSPPPFLLLLPDAMIV